MKRLLIATKNKGKAKEIKRLFSEFFDEIISLADIDNEIEIVEDGTSFEENAMKKAKVLFEMYRTPTLADDSGLEVEELNGLPGVYSARYAGEKATDFDRINKLLKDLDGIENRKAKFVCIFVFIDEIGNIYKTKGVCEGSISYDPKGENGFGYDPIFIPNGYNQTFGELSDEIKNQISHRARAAKQLKTILGELYEIHCDE